jgi:hypothetical protein
MRFGECCRYLVDEFDAMRDQQHAIALGRSAVRDRGEQNRFSRAGRRHEKWRALAGSISLANSSERRGLVGAEDHVM